MRSLPRLRVVERLLLMSYWDQASTDKLAAMWREGVPVRQIAGMLHKTRSAVIGRARRLGLGEHSYNKRIIPPPLSKRRYVGNVHVNAQGIALPYIKSLYGADH